MGQGETSRDRAMRLLHYIRERTEHAQQPVVVTDLAAECQLSIEQAQAAWEYLRDHRLIDTYSLRYSARVNARGIDFLDSRPTDHSGKGDLRAGSSTATGFGRNDSAEDLARAVEVSNELARLHTFLPQLTDSELSAYFTKSLPIGTFLQSKGLTFSVLTEDMLAGAFRREVDQRKSTKTQREVHETLTRKRNPWEFASWIAGIAAALIALVAFIYEVSSKTNDAGAPKKPVENTSQTPKGASQISQAAGDTDNTHPPLPRAPQPIPGSIHDAGDAPRPHAAEPADVGPPVSLYRDVSLRPITEEDVAPRVRRIGGFVGLLKQPDGGQLCVGWLLDQTHVLTAAFCVGGFEPNTRFAYQLANPGNSKNTLHAYKAVVNDELQYAILKLFEPLGADAKPLRGHVRDPVIGESVAVIQYGSDGRQGVSEKECRIIKMPQNDAIVRSDIGIAYTCDTVFRSGGAPIVAAKDGALLGIHLTETALASYGVRLKAIADKQPLVASALH